MHYNDIRNLSSLIPFRDEYFDVVRHDLSLIQSNQSNAIAKFICTYKDVKFGWNFIKFLIRNKKNLPSFVDNEYIYRAYNFERYGIPDISIIEAIAFDSGECGTMGSMLQSFLLIDEISFSDIAQRLGISLDVVLAYESLFFNVSDRKKEAAWLASIVYPETRFVEMSPNYVTETNYDWLLKRSGYNNGLEAVTHFSGLRSKMTVDISNAATKMENALMVNGYLLATNGYVNQHNAQGIFHAKTIIAAEKQSGNAASAVTNDFTGEMGSYVLDELIKFGMDTGLKQLTLQKTLNGDK